MKLLIINLKRSIDRKKNIEKQLKKFNITNYEFIEAIDGKYLDQSLYNSKKSKRILKKLINRSKPLLNTEVACALSHIKAHKRCIELNERCIVLEDDVILTNEFLPFNINTKYDLVYIGYKLLENNFKCKTVLQKGIHKLDTFYRPDIETILIDNKKYYQMPHGHIIFGTYAYSPSLKMCESLVSNTDIFAPIDLIFSLLNINKYCPVNVTVYPDRITQSTIGDRSE